MSPPIDEAIKKIGNIINKQGQPSIAKIRVIKKKTKIGIQGTKILYENFLTFSSFEK